MASYYDTFTEDEIVHLDIKELNRKIKQTRMCEEDIKAMKCLRRKRRLKSYDLNRNRRGKALVQSLVQERDLLQAEYENLRREVEVLQDNKTKLELLYLLDSYDRDLF